MPEYQGKRFKKTEGSQPRAASHAAPAGKRFAPPARSGGGSARHAASPAPQHAPAAGTRPVAGVAPVAPVRAAAPRGSSRRGGRRRSVLPAVLIGVGVVLLLVAAGIFGFALYGYHQAGEVYSGLERYAEVSDSEGDGAPDVDFDALAAINPDIVGWIYIPGTGISYPVVQGDDNTTYLNVLFDGTRNGSGSIFLDADQEAPGMQGQQTTIYGHHMNDGSMFCRIDDASNQDVFDEIECAYYITRDTTYRLSPIMTSVVEETHVEVRQANFGSQEDLKTYLMDMLAKASAKAPDARERVAAADRVLSLVTCNWAIGGRFGSVRSVMILNVDEAYPTAASDAASDAAATDAA